jgi:hypothetical protein
MSFEWLAGVDVVWGVGIVVALHLLLLVWAVTRPRRLVLRGAPDAARWRDLRLWIVPLLLVQIGLYILLR